MKQAYTRPNDFQIDLQHCKGINTISPLKFSKTDIRMTNLQEEAILTQFTLGTSIQCIAITCEPSSSLHNAAAVS